jgi:hypothetical protein
MRVLGVAACVVAVMAAAYGDGPPPAHTGGFGEPTCRYCHADNPADDPGGSAAILGLPETFEPGRTYELLVAVTRPGLVRAGFQLAARSQRSDSSVTQAGGFHADGPAVTIVPHEGIEYLQHAPDGTQVAQPDTAVWTLTWTAPVRSAPVTFHLAANASNDDGSEFGDFIYLMERHVRAAQR